MELLLLLAVAGMITASVKVWLVAATRWRRGSPAVPYEPHGPAPWSLVDLAVMVVVYVSSYLALAGLLMGALDAGAGPTMRQLAAAMAATSLANLFSVVFIIGWIRYRTGAAWSDLGLRFDCAASDLRLGLATFAAVSVPVYALQALLSQFVTEQHPLVDLLKQNRQPAFVALGVFTAVLVAPFTEEFFFRVLLQGWFESLASRPGAADVPAEEGRPPFDHADAADCGLYDPGNPYSAAVSTAAYPQDESNESAEGADQAELPAPPPNRGIARLAIVMSSLIFALMHLGHGAAPFPLFFLALALGYLYQQTGRLLPSVVVHLCLNGASLIALWFSLAFGIE